MSALVLSLSDIALTFGGAPLLTGTQLNIGPHARAALVGRNGCGKSTLLKIAAGLIEPDRGERYIHPDLKTIYVSQEPDFTGHETALDYAASQLPEEDRHRAEHALDDFGVPYDANLATVSGGEAKRVALAAAFAHAPDIVLLDEPTNHLDIPAIIALEARIKALRGAVVLISHDRRFLENLTNETIWIDRGETRHLSRGFAHFEAWRDKTLEEEEAERHKLGRKIAAEEDWVRYGVTARRKRNMRRMGELTAMREKLKTDRRPVGRVAFEASLAEAAGKRVIVADGIAKSYGERTIVNDFSTVIARGDKVGIVAPNGAGKTTLLSMLTGALAPDRGSIEHSATVELISLDQRRAALKPEMRLADAITDDRGDFVTINGTKKHVSTYLQEFLFSPEQWRAPVSALSGGERGRLALAAALAKPSNLLALDEPTNDLDLETLDLLEDMLADYQGAVLLISHDRHFLNRIVESVITTDPDTPGGWRRYPGGYDDMISQRGSAPGTIAPTTPSEKSAPKKSAAPKTARAKLSYKEQFALDALPGKIEQLEADIESINAALADPALFEKDAAAFNKKAAELEDAKTALAAAEEEWLRLEEKRESLSR